jgi:hypothetical protein
MNRLKASEVAQYRATMLREQDGHCALCGDRIEAGEVAVLDHDHKTGHCRGVLHRGCNSMLGVIENGRARYSLLGGRLGRMLGRVFNYIHAIHEHRPLHPTHRTADEKRVRTNKRAAARRAAKKVTA